MPGRRRDGNGKAGGEAVVGRVRLESDKYRLRLPAV